jgi:hypothetical protein
MSTVMKVGDKMEYKRLSNVTKKSLGREKKRLLWESFVIQMENSFY